jgi:secreted trypsin-like serine protease
VKAGPDVLSVGGVIRNWKLAALTATLLCIHATPATARGTPLLVGGSTAPAQAWPSIALLEGHYSDGNGGKHVYHCTGSVIAASWIVTAAHCAFGNPQQPPDSMEAVLGASDYTDPKRQVIAIDHFAPDPAYDAEHELNDVALLHLSQPTSAPAMPLATTATSDAGGYRSDDGVPNAAGWGAVDEAGSKFTTQLQQAYLQIHTADACGAAVAGFDPSTQTCAGTAGQATACFGDSGGPLVKTDASTGQPVLWGLTSYRPAGGNGEAPCSLAVPAVFTWIPAFADFIQSTMNAPLAAAPAATAPDQQAAASAGDAQAPSDAGAQRCASARRTLSTARKTEQKRLRQLHTARRAHASSVIRARTSQRSHRYRVARARRIKAASTVRRACAAPA